MATDYDGEQLTALTAAVAGAYVGHHAVARADLPVLIRTIHDALSEAGSPTPEIASLAKPTPAQIRKSITPEALISFEDNKPYKALKRHLRTRGLTVDEYKAKWGLPQDYPTVAASYSAARSAMAKAIGLGQSAKRRKPRAKNAS